jgi:hypothetical protein
VTLIVALLFYLDKQNEKELWSGKESSVELPQDVVATRLIGKAFVGSRNTGIPD